jgi:hypothetical protein
MGFEKQFQVYQNGIFWGVVWLTPRDLEDLVQIGRAVSGLRRYRSKSRIDVTYREVSSE